MPREMDQLVAEQERYAQEVLRVITNYKKDPSDRKVTALYYEDRLRRLEAAWSLVEKIDEEIRSLPSPDLSHAYFTTDVYEKTAQRYEEYSKYFADKIAQFKREIQIQVSEPSPRPPTSKAVGSNDTTTRAKDFSSQSDDKHPPKGPVNESTSTSVSMQQSSDITRIIRRQGAIIQTLRRLLANLENIDAQQHPRSLYQLKFNSIQRYWSQVEEHNNTIWELSDDPSMSGYDISDYIELEEKVQQTLAELSATLDELPTQPAAPLNSTLAATTMLNLPKITLPKFDGDYSKWRQFFDLFSQMVHNQPLSNCQKMWYLKTNLAGEAEKLIRHFALTEENYTTAWKVLQDRYENQRLLAADLINKLLNQQSHAAETPSATSIKTMHDITQECLLGLENLGVPTTNWDPLLLHILLKKLDRTTHSLYEQSLTNPRCLQSLKGFLSFLETRFQSLEALGNKTKNTDNGYKKYQCNNKPSSLASVACQDVKCVACNGSHPLFRCQNFLKMPTTTRRNIVEKHKICFNCLRKGHTTAKCTLRGCTKCTKRHNTLLHMDPTDNADGPTSRPPTNSQDQRWKANSTSNSSVISSDQPLTLATYTSPIQGSYVLLSTARVILVTDSGKEIECRAILDSGSQVNLITERALKKLGATPHHTSMCIQGIGQGRQQTQKRINLQLKSRINGFSTRLEAFVMNQIVSPQPRQPLNISTWAIPRNIQLADPNFDRPDHIDLLIGAEFYLQLLSIGQIKISQDLPTLQNTVFGWIVAGRINQTSGKTSTCGICTEEVNIEKAIERFWQIEENEGTQECNFTLSERRCEALFNQTVRRDTDGRFIVSLPFAEEPTQLGESRDIALRRFFALERKLGKNNDLRQQYTTFMEEYIRLGHMEEIDIDSISSPHYFLPHHSVLKPDSSTTKLRVVFDASAKTSTNVSLNDILYTGPTIQDDLFSILLRFRLPRFVFTADIEKMYRQVILQEEDRKYHLIWWRNQPSEPLKCYQLRTVTYGTSSAPYLAIKCLQRLAHDEAAKHPVGAEILQRDFYVDDVMTGANSLVLARDMQTQLTSLLKTAGFKLRKWCANHPQLLRDIPPGDQEIQLDFTDEDNSYIKTLGLAWMPKDDHFKIKINPTSETKITKRIVASEIARLFDPLGIMAPVTVTAKIFLQRLWEIKLDWDASLPAELHTSWTNFRKNLSTLNSIRIQRHVFSQEVPKLIQLHAFSDASEKAYGAAIYVRSKNNEGRLIVRLLCAKSRVAPVKKLPLPRLELCAAKLAAELLQRVKRCLKLEQTHSYLWTDSEIVLAWINSTSSSFQTFVANRIAAIQRVTLPQQWRHVKSKENPADLVSRGVSPEKLGSCNLWFYGPLYLHGTEDTWPSPYTKRSECNLERKQSALSTTAHEMEDQQAHFVDKIQHNNSFRRLQRIVGYVVRFITQARRLNKGSTSFLTLTAQELDEALFIIIKRMQEVDFQEEIQDLSRYKEIRKTSPITSLSPFLDERGILRVGGRLEASELSYDAKHQALLPHTHELTKLLMSTYHQENYHIGPQGLLCSIRQRFWPIKGKSIARSVVQHCIKCARSKPKPFSQMMGNLPSTRVQPARPFVNAGVDFCGPIWIHYKTRGKRPQKGYVAVFCCFATKAVHLEVVSDLSTESFIGSLKRFIGRRGHCRNLYCDNATNFVGARNQLAELRDSIYTSVGKEEITTKCSQKGIDFHFIPPREPHFGGLWEAAVKSAKHLLLRTVSSASLTYEELETAMIEIEAILNSRPLTPLSSDPNDLCALTPGHFLIGEPLTTPIDTLAKPMKANLATRWKLVSHIKHEFWKRWSTEYLHELQYRFKWKQSSPNVKPGMLVIIKEDNSPVMKWPLGRIERVYEGEDGLVRVVDVRTSTGVFRRAIHKLSPLPCEDKSKDDVVEHPDEEEQSIQTDSKSKRIKRPITNYTSSESSNDNTGKRKRKSLGSSLLAVLLTCIVLPLTEADLIKITPFKPQLGIHFENIGITELITTDWNLIVYYDLHPYWMEFDVLKNGTAALQHLCDQYTVKSACRQIISQFKHFQDELNIGNELLPPNGAPNRQRRGVLNIVGTVANALFGVLDEQYAEEMSKTINSIKGNEDHLRRLLKNQTSVVDSTINIVRKDQVAVANKFSSLDNQINQIINRLKGLNEEDNLMRLQQQFMSIAIQMTLITTNLQRVQSTILDVITDSNHGRINPLLLAPYQLHQEVSVIRNHLPSTLRLPTKQDNTLELYKLMTVKSRATKDHVIFQIKIPLLNWERFELLRVLPVPIWINSTFVTIKPHSPFLAVTPHRDRYYPISELELLSCSLIDEVNHLCKQLHPVYNKGADICGCEMDFLNNAPNITNCKLTQLGRQPVWLQLSHSNQWLFAVSSSTTINTACDNELLSTTINGSGLLRIEPHCIIKEPFATIHGHQTYTTGTRSSYTMLGITADDIPQAKLPRISPSKQIYHPQIEEMKDLHHRLQSLDLSNLPNRLHRTTVHHFTISYVALFTVVVLAVWLIWKCRKDAVSDRPIRPHPKPRKRHSNNHVVDA